jgi:hypothetical protein
MATITGPSPVTFISEDTGATQNAGTQYQIPLSLITYDTTKTPPVLGLATPWTKYLVATDQALALAYIQNLINDGVLTVNT